MLFSTCWTCRLANLEPHSFSNFTLAPIGSSPVWSLFLNLGWLWSLDPLLFKFIPILPTLYSWMDWSYPMSLAGVISSCSMVVQYSSLNRSATPVTNLLFSSLGLDTRYLTYLDSIENIKEYLLPLILPFLRLIQCSTFISLQSLGKYFPRKASLNSTHSIGPYSTGLLYFH